MKTQTVQMYWVSIIALDSMKSNKEELGAELAWAQAQDLINDLSLHPIDKTSCLAFSTGLDVAYLYSATDSGIITRVDEIPTSIFKGII